MLPKGAEIEAVGQIPFASLRVEQRERGRLIAVLLTAEVPSAAVLVQTPILITHGFLSGCEDG
jgi:hypothetical protein